MFDLLSSGGEPVVTGHADGVITIDLAEGDDAHREALRVQLAEPYRTMLGHLRHEIGHYYWTVLVDGRPRATGSASCSATSAPTTREALQRHYAAGRAAGLEQEPREHLRHRAPVGGLGRDVRALPAHPRHPADRGGLRHPRRRARRGRTPRPRAAAPPEDPERVRRDHRHWLPLTYALNAVNRSMGKDDLYPFVLSAPVMAKLDFVHRLSPAELW